MTVPGPLRVRPVAGVLSAMAEAMLRAPLGLFWKMTRSFPAAPRRVPAPVMVVRRSP